jgi:hypothetical protein
MQAAPSSATSPSHPSSGPTHPHASKGPTGNRFILTIEDKRILKDKYLKDFETGERSVRTQLIGNAVRELALLRPAETVVSKRKGTRVCVTAYICEYGSYQILDYQEMVLQ